MAAKLDIDVPRGRAGVAMGELSGPNKHPGPPQFGGDQVATDLIGLNSKGHRGGWKIRGKEPEKGTDKGGDKGKGKGKTQQTNLNVTADRPSKPRRVSPDAGGATL